MNTKRIADDAYLQGFALAAWWLSTNGYPSMASDMMTSCGVSLDDLRDAKVDAQTLDGLQKDSAP